MPVEEGDRDWQAVIGRALAFICLAQADLRDKGLAPQAEFLETLGLHEAGLDRLIRAGYDLLHLITFFTVGPKEARAWTVNQGTRAPQAAGVIHTDFERGFIKAEVIRWDELLRHGSEAAARAKGALRVEGKEYVVQDGDMMHFLFNV